MGKLIDSVYCTIACKKIKYLLAYLSQYLRRNLRYYMALELGKDGGIKAHIKFAKFPVMHQ